MPGTLCQCRCRVRRPSHRPSFATCDASSGSCPWHGDPERVRSSCSRRRTCLRMCDGVSKCVEEVAFGVDVVATNALAANGAGPLTDFIVSPPHGCADRPIWGGKSTLVNALLGERGRPPRGAPRRRTGAPYGRARTHGDSLRWRSHRHAGPTRPGTDRIGGSPRPSPISSRSHAAAGFATAPIAANLGAPSRPRSSRAACRRTDWTASTSSSVRPRSAARTNFACAGRSRSPRRSARRRRSTSGTWAASSDNRIRRGRGCV